jgi:uncharacterized integral membrane protein
MDTNQESSSVQSHSATLEKASFVALIVTLVLGFWAFTSQTFLSLAATKTIVIAVGILISVIFFVLSKIKSKSVSVSLSPIFWTASAAAIIVLVSALLSPNIASSLIGKSFTPDTGIFLLILLASGFLSFSLTKDQEQRTFFVFSAILGSFGLLALYHTVRFFTGPGFLSLGVFTSTVYTVIGSWHDLGTLAGLSLVISLVTLQLLPITNKIARILFIATFALSSVILIVVDLQYIWIIVAITTLCFAAYKYFLNGKESKNSTKSIPFFSLIVGIVAILLAWGPGFVGTANLGLITKANASYSEVSLPWRLTMDVAEPTLKVSPFFGAGPARFANQYLLYKPEVVNTTQFWSSSFSSGNDFILTSLVTEGAFGFIVWIVLVILFIRYGMKTLLGANEISGNSFSRYAAATSFFAAGFLWLSLVSYMPSHAILLVTFLLSGVFVANIGGGLEKTVRFSAGKAKIPALIVLWLFIVIAAGVIFFYAKATLAEVYFEKAVTSLNAGGTLSTTAQDLQTAIKLNPSDVYYQAIAQMDVYAINQIITNATTTPDQATVQLIGGLVNDGINSSRIAQKFDTTNAYNYLAEAQVSEVAAGIQVPNAYANATSSYQKALVLDPLDPSIYLSRAKLDFFEKDNVATNNDLNVALQLKPDYADAIFEIGVISYTNKDYATAVAAFTRVLQIQSDYPNGQAALNIAQAAQKGAPASSAVSSAPTLPAGTASSTPSTAGTKSSKTK